MPAKKEICTQCKGFGYKVKNVQCENCDNVNGMSCYICENRKFYEDCNACYTSGMYNLRK